MADPTPELPLGLAADGDLPGGTGRQDPRAAGLGRGARPQGPGPSWSRRPTITWPAGPVRKIRCGPTARPSAAGGSSRASSATWSVATSASRSSGCGSPVPFMLAPIGVMSILHKDADLAVARAARSLGVPLILSTASSTTMEEVAAAMGEAPRWFQLYWPKDDELAASFVSRAERAGYGAIVVTLDTCLLGWRERDIQNAYLPFLLGRGPGELLQRPGLSGQGRRRSPIEPGASDRVLPPHLLRSARTPGTTSAGCCQSTRLPVLVKGVLHA